MATITSVASSSRPLAGRQPLSTLPISLFVGPSGSMPSPVSIPLKRTSLPAEEGSASKVRRISLEAGEETVRKRRTPTQREMDVMDKDDLGVGKSPARRLFGVAATSPSPRLTCVFLPAVMADERFWLTRDNGRGVSGAIEMGSGEAGPSSRPYTPSSPSASPLTPALDSFTAPATVIIENGVEISIHHPGFSLFHDTSPNRAMTPLLLTPKGKGKEMEVSTLAVDAPSHLAPSPSSTPGSRYNENQENIPPNPNLPTPTKGGSDKGTPTKAKWLEDVSDLTGSGRRRVLEKSKLANLLASHQPEDEILKPGRATRPRQAKHRETPRDRMKREVDRI